MDSSIYGREVCRRDALDIVGATALSVFRGAEMARCTDALGNPLVGDAGCGDWVPIDPFGRARIELGGADIFALTRERYRIYPRRIEQSGPIAIDLFTRGIADATATSIDGFDPSLGVMHFAQFDCLGQFASAKVELTNPASATRCYWAGFAVLNCPADYGLAGIFVNVPLGKDVEVKSSNVDGARSTRTVMVAPDWITYVHLWPLTTAEAGH